MPTRFTYDNLAVIVGVIVLLALLKALLGLI